MNASKTGIMAVLITIANAAWLYAYTSLGFHFSYIFEFQNAMAMLNTTTLAITIATGLFMAFSVMITLYFAAILEKKDAVVGTIIAGMLTLAFSIIVMKASPIFLCMLFFYATGLVVIAAITKVKPKGLVEKVKTGWGAGMKLTYALALGALVTGFYFANLNIDEYQNLTKKSMVEFTKSSVEEMNISNMMTNMDIGSAMGNIDLSQILTKDKMEQTVRDSLTNQSIIDLVGQSNYDALNETAKTQLINTTKELVVKQYMQNYDPAKMQSSMKGVTDKIAQQVQQQILQSEQFKKAQDQITDQMVEQTMDSMPLMKTMLDMLPIITGFTLLTAVILFGQVIISPLSAIASLALPTTKEEK